MEMFIWKVYFHRNSGARETKPEFQQKKHIFAEHIWMILQEGMDQKITSFFWMEHDGTIVLVDHRVFLFWTWIVFCSRWFQESFDVVMMMMMMEGWWWKDYFTSWMLIWILQFFFFEWIHHSAWSISIQMFFCDFEFVHRVFSWTCWMTTSLGGNKGLGRQHSQGRCLVLMAML